MEAPIIMSSLEHAPWREIPSFRSIDSHLEQVSGLIRRSLSANGTTGQLGPLFDHLNARSGKLLRPGLVLLTGQCFGALTDEHVRVAAMVEMIHHATLLHDDVIDNGHTRRGVPTVNHLWGNESAVLLGDFVLSRVFQMAADLDASVAKIIARTAIRVCEGELRQVSQRRNWQLTEAEYFEIIREKSASFFSGCCRLGALLANAGEAQAEAAARYGLSAGVAFQIADDLLDVTGDERTTGKTGHSDIAGCKLTLAMIHLLRTIDASRRAEVCTLLESPGGSRRELADLLARHGSLQYASERAQTHVAEAVRALVDLPAGAARDALLETARFMASRLA